MGNVEPPGQELLEPFSAAAGGGGVLVRAEHGDTDGAGVEAERVGADDVPVEAAVPALVDRAEAVDERVVADVVPAVAFTW